MLYEVITYCVSDERLGTVFRKDLDAAIEQIVACIEYGSFPPWELIGKDGSPQGITIDRNNFV